MGSSHSSPDSPEAASDEAKPKSLYQRMQDKKRGPISDEDIKKYTGKTRDELMTWAENQPGVGKNQLAGKLALGPASGLGGWGPDAEPTGADRGMKFPPKPDTKNSAG
ncbi:hypothetical protein XA68_16118 [Ophiocordyceps unilateralis]|uniref:Uncharacterized protein n=1 Tax=Ophiocordyceps unilateralis TaxID=268505 RepID=A0A2A9P738_OPHUN|nr:hypothetical protein XA68_16118 [Ophiocordyceps unilateralis]